MMSPSLKLMRASLRSTSLSKITHARPSTTRLPDTRVPQKIPLLSAVLAPLPAMTASRSRGVRVDRSASNFRSCTQCFGLLANYFRDLIKREVEDKRPETELSTESEDSTAQNGKLAQ